MYTRQLFQTFCEMGMISAHILKKYTNIFKLIGLLSLSELQAQILWFSHKIVQLKEKK